VSVPLATSKKAEQKWWSASLRRIDGACRGSPVINMCFQVDAPDIDALHAEPPYETR
jgi:hypothetical protein